MSISITPDSWHVKDANGQYRGTAIFSSMLPSEAQQIVTNSIAEINAVKATIPADYTELSDDVSNAKNAITDIAEEKVTSQNQFDNVFDKTGYYINVSTGEDVQNNNYKCTSKFYPMENYTLISDKIAQYFATSETIASLAIVYYDSSKTLVDYFSMGNKTKENKTINANARYFRVTTYASYTGQLIVSNSALPTTIDYTYTTSYFVDPDALPESLQNLSDDYDDGLGLSKNNYTDEDKAKVDSINESPDTFNSIEKVYYIGAGFTYTTPQAAYAQWVTDDKPKAVFYVSKGEYNVMNDPTSTSYTPFLFEDAEYVEIIGEDVNTTIIKSTTGKYVHSPIFIRSGNVKVKNITFIANHADNPSFDYSQSTTGLAGNAAYAMHIDGGSVGGTVIVENCRAWSYQSCGLGLGTIKNSQIIINGCDVRSFTDPESSYTDARVALSRGALAYHTYGADDTGDELFSLNDTFVYSKNGTRAMLITKTSGNAAKDLVCKRNLIQGDAIASVSSFVVGLDLLTLSSDSYGNNVPGMNYSA